MQPKDKPEPEEEEDGGAIDPRRGPIPTEAPEDETETDSRDLESDKKESDETANSKR